MAVKTLGITGRSARTPGRSADFSFELRVLAVERRGSTDDLHDIRGERRRELVRGVANREVGGFRELKLHQLVCAERVVDGLAGCVSQSVLADVDHRAKMVRLGTEVGALFRGERHSREFGYFLVVGFRDLVVSTWNSTTG